MKAAFMNEFGSAERIIYGELDEPVCGSSDVLMKTICVSVNNIDTFVRSGKYKTNLPFPFTLGRDMVGIVQKTGSCVNGFAEGDIAWTNSMGYDGRQGVTSEYVSVPSERLYHLPKGIDPISAVASVHSSATAAILLTKIAKAKIGDSILIHGAAGHVGSKLVSLAHQMGLFVVTSSSPDDFSKLKALGADQPIGYKEIFDSALQKYNFDLIVDTSGKVSLNHSIKNLGRNGKILMITPAPSEPVDTWGLYTKRGSILGYVISQAGIEELNEASKIINAQFIKGLLLDDSIKTLPLSEAAAAHKLQEEPHGKKPKYILTVS